MATQGGKYQRKPTDQKKRAICDDSLIIVELKIRHFLAAFLDILLKTVATFSHLSCYFPVVPCLEKFCGTSICSLYCLCCLCIFCTWDSLHKFLPHKLQIAGQPSWRLIPQPVYYSFSWKTLHALGVIYTQNLH